MKRISHVLLLASAALAAPACSNDPTGGTTDPGLNCGNNVCDPGETETSCPLDCAGSGSGDQYDQLLGQRVVDYNAALRIASLRLTGHIPSMADITTVATASDPKAAYTTLLGTYMSGDDFKREMFYFWRDTFKMGGTAALDTAPALAAQLSTENGSYMNLFTQASGNCPTFADPGGGGAVTITAAECGNGGPKAGVLTNPGVHAQYFSNFAFRRTRWVQEVFVCTKFPAEVAATPTDEGGAAPYTGKFPFNSIASPTNGGGRVNFQDVSAVVCANCHSNINHIAPLFAYYDMNGMYQSAISVPTPLDGAPMAQLTDYLPAGEATAWRYGVPAADIPALGAAMAADPDVAQCAVARMWNWALGKTDIVDTLQVVPPETIQAQVDAFTSGGYKLKDLITAVYTSDDFVKF
jgi:hypothetical protein